MEDFKKKSNFDRAILYYSAPKEFVEEPIVKSAIPQVETYNSSNRRHSCITCKKRFFTKNALNNHIITHSPDDPIDTNVDHNSSDWKNLYTQNKGIRCKRGECNFNALDTVEYSKHCKTCEGTRLTTSKTTAFCESCDNYFSSDHHQKIHSVLFHSNNQGITLADNDLEGDHLSEYLLINLLKNDIREPTVVSPSKCRDSSKSNRSLSDSSLKENNNTGESLINGIDDCATSNTTNSNNQKNTINPISSVEASSDTFSDVNSADTKRDSLGDSENKSNDRINSEVVETPVVSSVLENHTDTDLAASQGSNKSDLEAECVKESVENNVNETDHTINNKKEFVAADRTVAVVGETSRPSEVARIPITPEESTKTCELACANPDESNADKITYFESIAQKTVFLKSETCREQRQKTTPEIEPVEKFEKMAEVDDNLSKDCDSSHHVDSFGPLSEANDVSSVVSIPNSDKASNKVDSIEGNSNPTSEDSDASHDVDSSKLTSKADETSSTANKTDSSVNTRTESNDQNVCQMNKTTRDNLNANESVNLESDEKYSNETSNCLSEILDIVSGNVVCNKIHINNDENTSTENPISNDTNAELGDSQESNSHELSENEKSSSSMNPDNHDSASNSDDNKKAVKHNSLPEKRIRKIKKLADDFTLLMDSNPELRARILPKDKRKKDQRREPKFSSSPPKNKSTEKSITEDTKKKQIDRKSVVEKKIYPEMAKKPNISLVKSKEKNMSLEVPKIENISRVKLDERKISPQDSKKKKIIHDESSRKTTQQDDSAEKKNRLLAKKKNLDQDNSMVAQRSVRQRKKLVLPDFDYGVEGKQDADDTDDEPKKFTYSVNSTSDRPYTPVEKVKKAETRGRPRKYPILEKTLVDNANVSKLSKDIVRTKQEKPKKIENDGEEFCLNSTINEVDSLTKTDDLTIDDQEEDDPQNELHSWLKQVDFSEQSPFDSWSPDEKLKARKRVKNKLKSRRNVVVARPAFLKKTSQLIMSNKPPGEIKKPVTDVQDLPVDVRKKEKVQNTDVDTTNNTMSETTSNPTSSNTTSNPTSSNTTSNTTSPNAKEMSALKKRKPGRPRKGLENLGNVGSNSATRPQKSKTATVTSEKDSPSTEVGTQTNVHMLKSPLEEKDNKRVPKKKLPFDPDSNSGQSKLSPKKNSPPEERVNLEPKHAKRIPKRKIPFDPDGEPELKKKRIRKKKLTLEEQLEDPLRRREATFSCMSIVRKGEEMKDGRKQGRGRPRLNPVSKTVSRPVDIVSNQEETATDKIDIKEEIKVENDESFEIKKEESDFAAEEQDQSAFECSSIPTTADNTLNMTMENQSAYGYDSVPEASDTTANTTTELSESNQNDTARGKKERKPKKRTSIMKPKLDAKENGNTSDEMKKIDEDLYKSDVRNRSRYSRNFKKQPDCLKEQESMHDIVTCGRCKKKMTRAHYLTNHEISHYYLSWIEGEAEINLNDDNEMIRIMQSYISSDALRKKAIRLACEQCDKVMKSVIGYVSHVRFCQKSDEQELLETCTLCAKTLKPSSIRHHYVKYHGISKFTFGPDGRMLPDLSSRDVSRKIIETTVLKDGRMGFERESADKTDILRDEVFWTNLKTSYDLYMCMGLGCKHMTLSKDDLKTHILSCAATFCEFSCVACSFRTKYENEIIYHSKKRCKETSDVEDNEQVEIKEETPTVEMSSDRRVSRRLKKRKFVFDYDDIDDDDHGQKRKRSKRKDLFDDYKPSEGDTESSCDSGPEHDPGFRSRFSRKLTEDGGLRQAFLSYCGNRPSDSLNWTVDVRLKTFSAGPVHEHLKVNVKAWETVSSISDSVQYTPSQRKSPHVTFDRQSFAQYDIFQSAVVKGVPLCYTGGPVWSMAWAPLPAHIVEQYLAVASLQDMNQKIKVDSPIEFPAMVQIWKFGSIDNISNDIHKPTLVWAIAHRYGAVWSMEWCPTGGFDSTSKPARLGILALGTSAGCVVIYSVPRLDCIADKTAVVANPEPDLLLKVRSDNVQCTRIVWQRNYLPNIIFGGLSDGSIALWNVSTVSPILKKDKVVYPFRTFEAHTSAITALDVHWVDSGRFFLTGSIDRLVKYWDMEDLSGPMYEQDKSALVLSAAWMHHWAVSAQGYDYFSGVEPASYLCLPRDSEKRKSILNINDSIWSVAYSDWNDAVAVSSNGGFVSVFSAKHLAAVSFKTAEFDKIITQTDLVPKKGNEKNVDENGDSTGDLYDYATITKDNAIFFDDRIKEKPDHECLISKPDRSNVLSINKVSWNNNYNNFNWLAVGYECGFVRVIRVERYDKHHLTKFYKMNENSSIKLL